MLFLHLKLLLIDEYRRFFDEWLETRLKEVNMEQQSSKEQKEREEQNRQIKESREREKIEGTPEWTERQEKLAKLEQERILRLTNHPKTVRLQTELLYIAGRNRESCQAEIWRKLFTPKNTWKNLKCTDISSMRLN